MEVTDDGDVHALPIELVDDMRHRGSSVFIVDCDTHQFRSSASECGHLLYRGDDISSIGVGHRLHHDWCIAAHPHPANRGRNRFPALNVSHAEYLV